MFRVFHPAIGVNGVRLRDRAESARFLNVSALEFAALENAGALPVPVRVGGLPCWLESELAATRKLLRLLENCS